MGKFDADKIDLKKLIPPTNEEQIERHWCRVCKHSMVASNQAMGHCYACLKENDTASNHGGYNNLHRLDDTCECFEVKDVLPEIKIKPLRKDL